MNRLCPGLCDRDKRYVRFFMVMIFCCIVFLFGHLSLPAFAGERVLTLEEAYTLAIRGHEAIKIAEEGLYQFEQDKKKAMSNILPGLNAEGSYTKFSEVKGSEEFFIIQPEHSVNYSLRLSLPLYRGGREWSALRQAKHMMEVGERSVSITTENIVMEVSLAYFNVLKVEKEQDIKEADLKRGVERARVAAARFKVGEVTKAVVLRADAEVAGIQAELARVRRDLLVAEDWLARLVGRPPGFKLEEPPRQVMPSEKIVDLIDTAFDKREDYLRSRAEEEIAREGIKFARGGFMPTLKLEGIYSGRDQDPISSAFFNKESMFANLTLSLPLFEGGLRIAEVREAKSKLREVRLKRINIKKDIELQVRDAFYNLEALDSALEFYEKQVSFAEENYNTVFKQFTHGLATSVDVIDANSTLVAAQKSLANSTIDLQVAIIELKRRMGVLLDEVLHLKGVER